MKHLLTGAAILALLGGAAFAQQAGTTPNGNYGSTSNPSGQPNSAGGNSRGSGYQSGTTPNTNYGSTSDHNKL